MYNIIEMFNYLMHKHSPIDILAEQRLAARTHRAAQRRSVVLVRAVVARPFGALLVGLAVGHAVCRRDDFPGGDETNVTG